MSLNDSQYIPGEVARLSLTVTDLDGLVADPGAVVLKVKQPDGTVVYPRTEGAASSQA